LAVDRSTTTTNKENADTYQYKPGHFEYPYGGKLCDFFGRWEEVQKKQGKPKRNRLSGPRIVRMSHQATSGDGRVFGRSTPSAAELPVQCLLRLATGMAKAHRFASPSFDGFALSRMKGVFDPGEGVRLASKFAAKTGKLVCLCKASSQTRLGQTWKPSFLRINPRSGRFGASLQPL
jgi:hypothetical protein